MNEVKEEENSASGGVDSMYDLGQLLADTSISAPEERVNWAVAVVDEVLRLEDEQGESPGEISWGNELPQSQPPESQEADSGVGGGVSGEELNMETEASDQETQGPAFIPILRPNIPVLVVPDSDSDDVFAHCQVQEEQAGSSRPQPLDLSAPRENEVIDIIDSDGDDNGPAVVRVRGSLSRSRPKVSSTPIESNEQEGKRQSRRPARTPTRRLGRNRAKTQTPKDDLDSDSEVEVLFWTPTPVLKESESEVEIVEEIRPKSAKGTNKRKHYQKNPVCVSNVYTNEVEDDSDSEDEIDRRMELMVKLLEEHVAEVNEFAEREVNILNPTDNSFMTLSRGRKSVVKESDKCLKAVGLEEMASKKRRVSNETRNILFRELAKMKNAERPQEETKLRTDRVPTEVLETQPTDGGHGYGGVE